MKRARGFTLIEIIVVIALLGVASTLGFVMFSKVSSLWNQIRTRAELSAAADTVFTGFRKDLSDVVSAKLAGIAIQGTARTIQDNRFFRVSLDDDQIQIPVETVAGPEGLRQRLDVQYHIDRQKSGACALLRTASVPGASESATLKVADGVLAICIEYQGKEPGAAWQREWSPPATPAAVRVSVTMMDPSRPFEQISRKAVFPVRVD